MNQEDLLVAGLPSHTNPSEAQTATSRSPSQDERLQSPSRSIGTTPNCSQDDNQLELQKHVQSLVHDIHTIIEKVAEFQIQFSLSWKKSVEQTQPQLPSQKETL
jgi:hypothetical protein